MSGNRNEKGFNYGYYWQEGAYLTEFLIEKIPWVHSVRR